MVTAYVTGVGVGVGVGAGVAFIPALTPEQEVAAIPRAITVQRANARTLRLPRGMPVKTNPAIPSDSSHVA